MRLEARQGMMQRTGTLHAQVDKNKNSEKRGESGGIWESRLTVKGLAPWRGNSGGLAKGGGGANVWRGRDLRGLKLEEPRVAGVGVAGVVAIIVVAVVLVVAAVAITGGDLHTALAVVGYYARSVGVVARSCVSQRHGVGADGAFVRRGDGGGGGPTYDEGWRWWTRADECEAAAAVTWLSSVKNDVKQKINKLWIPRTLNIPTQLFELSKKNEEKPTESALQVNKANLPTPHIEPPLNTFFCLSPGSSWYQLVPAKKGEPRARKSGGDRVKVAVAGVVAGPGVAVRAGVAGPYAWRAGVVETGFGRVVTAGVVTWHAGLRVEVVSGWVLRAAGGGGGGAAGRVAGPCRVVTASRGVEVTSLRGGSSRVVSVAMRRVRGAVVAEAELVVVGWGLACRDGMASGRGFRAARYWWWRLMETGPRGSCGDVACEKRYEKKKEKRILELGLRVGAGISRGGILVVVENLRQRMAAGAMDYVWRGGGSDVALRQ
ncbi:hypothetical protein EDB85DRAFT_1900232 [Lactarius pseudohatsudake]|nr:hypothetical protein EDB85DRAFT_1900232 [Lactarius pseudohatsudake]